MAMECKAYKIKDKKKVVNFPSSQGFWRENASNRNVENTKKGWTLFYFALKFTKILPISLKIIEASRVQYQKLGLFV